jgi:signal recognition particle subunit SRP54
VDALEEFHPERIANRILGMGDIVSLVEKAAETIDAEKAQKIADKMKKGAFDLDDLSDQLKQMEKLGGMGGLMGMMPGMGKMKAQMADAGMDDKTFARQIAIIGSMTKAERANPDILKHSRKKRIAAGSGTDAAAINKPSQDAPADGRHDEGYGRQGQGRRHDARGHGRPGPEDGPAWRHGWNGRHAGSVENEIPRNSRRCRNRPKPPGSARTGLGAWKLPGLGGPSLPGLQRTGSSRPSEEEVRVGR